MNMILIAPSQGSEHAFSAYALNLYMHRETQTRGGLTGVPSVKSPLPARFARCPKCTSIIRKDSQRVRYCRRCGPIRVQEFDRA